MQGHIMIILTYLRKKSKDSSQPPEQRKLAFYMLAMYEKHRHDFRLLAQYEAFAHKQLQIPQSININPLEATGTHSLVSRCAKQIEDLVIKYDAKPYVADFEGQPCELISIFPKKLDDAMSFRKRLNMHKKIIAYERLADVQVAAYVRKYGYHYVFRAGLTQYYLTKVVVEHYNFFAMDARSVFWRRQTQDIIYEAIDKNPNLNEEELRLLIMATAANPDQALWFRNWLVACRNSYHAMKACIAEMDNVRNGQAPGQQAG